VNQQKNRKMGEKQAENTELWKEFSKPHTMLFGGIAATCCSCLVCLFWSKKKKKYAKHVCGASASRNLRYMGIPCPLSNELMHTFQYIKPIITTHAGEWVRWESDAIKYSKPKLGDLLDTIRSFKHKKKMKIAAWWKKSWDISELQAVHSRKVNFLKNG